MSTMLLDSVNGLAASTASLPLFRKSVSLHRRVRIVAILERRSWFGKLVMRLRPEWRVTMIKARLASAGALVEAGKHKEAAQACMSALRIVLLAQQDMPTWWWRKKRFERIFGELENRARTWLDWVHAQWAISESSASRMPTHGAQRLEAAPRRLAGNSGL